MIDGGEVLRFLAAFAAIGVALLGFAFAARSGGRLSTVLQRRRGRIVEIVETTALPHAGSLHVIKIGDAYFVIGRSDHAISLLREIPKETVEAVASDAPATGARMLLSRPR